MPHTAIVLNLDFSLSFCYYILVRIFKNKWFHRFAGKEGIADSELKEIVKQLENGQFYADLGGGVYKMRLARQSEGKKGGSFRLIVIFKSEFRTFFVYGFPKSELGNISEKELRVFKGKAKDNFSFTDEQMSHYLKNEIFIEIL